MTTSISKAERGYIQAGILASPPSRADGRPLHVYRTIALETGVAPLANGSARLSIGRNPHDGSGGTEVLAATKLEVETIGPDGGSKAGGYLAQSPGKCHPLPLRLNSQNNPRKSSPSAYPHLQSSALEDLQYDYTTILSDILTHPSLRPSNLTILKGKKSWLLNVDLIVMSDAGNVYDAMFMAARAALSNTKVPRTRAVEYTARPTRAGASGGGGIMGGALGKSTDLGRTGDMDVDAPEEVSGFDTRRIASATDFELPDYWDEGRILTGRPVGRYVLHLTSYVPRIRDLMRSMLIVYQVPPSHDHFLDATSQEEAATPLRLLLIFAMDHPTPGSVRVQGMRTLGSGEFKLDQSAEMIKRAETYAREIWSALNGKLKEERLAMLKEQSKY